MLLKLTNRKGKELRSYKIKNRAQDKPEPCFIFL